MRHSSPHRPAFAPARTATPLGVVAPARAGVLLAALALSGSALAAPALAAPALAAHALAAHAPARAVTSRARPAPRAFDLDHAVTLRSYFDLRWSNDGRRLAFVVQTPDTADNALRNDLYMVERGQPSARRLTRHPKPSISPTFSPSGDTLAFTATRGDGEAKQAIYMLSLRGGDPWSFGAYDEYVGEVRWSPDGRWLAYVQVDTLPARVREWRRRKWDQTVEDERLQYPHLWVIDVATGAKRRLVAGANYVWDVRWSPDSRRIAFQWSPTGAADDGDLQDIGVVDVATGAMRMLGAIGSAFSWSPDSKWIAWSSSEHREIEVAKSDVWIAGAAGGQPINLTAGFDESPYTPVWSAGSDTLFFHVARGVSTALAAVPRAGGPVRILADRDGWAGQLTMGAGDRAAWVESHPGRPDEVVIADHPALAGTPVTDLNAAVRDLELGETSTVRWTSSDGVRVEGVLLRPAHAPRGKLPTLVLLHGSPYGSRFDLAFQPKAQYFASHGYQVFMPNFRASGGYGAAFMLRKRADWGGQDWRDVSTGIDSLVARGVADGARLGLIGGSYGGYLTAWGITRTNRFAAACVERGIVDLAALWGQSDTRKYRAFEFQGRPWESFDTYRKSSPIAYVDRVTTPTLILVGENDRRTPVAQSTQLYRSLQSLGVPTELVRYPREGHVVREPRHVADMLARARGWFDRWIP